MQLTLDLWKRDRDLAALADQARVRGLLDSDVEFLVAVARADQSRKGESFACKSKRAWGKEIARDANTAVSAMRRLQQLGVLEFEVTDSGYAVLVDWNLVFALPPKEHVREAVRERLAEKKSEGGEGVVRGGEAAPRVLVQESKSRVTRVPVSSVQARGAGEPVVRPVRLPCRPWARSGGLSSDDLVRAVRECDEAILTGLYWAGVDQSWWEDCESFRVRFLACCYQAASEAKSSAMGLLTHMVRRNMRDRTDGERDSWITQEAEDWVCQTRRAWNRRRAEAYQRGERDECEEQLDRGVLVR